MAFVSWLQFGSASWLAFFHGIPRFSQTFLYNGDQLWWKLQSLYAFVRYVGGSETLAWTVHAIVVGTVAVALVVIWRSQRRYAIKAAALALGTLLTTPYLYMYDMVVLAITVAFVVREGLDGGFEPDEPIVLAGTMMLASTFLLVAEPVGLAANLLLAGLILRRAGLAWPTARVDVQQSSHRCI